MRPKADLESTANLVERLKAGDGSAREALAERYLPLLRRWAHGRLPPVARDLSDTDDLVQIALMRAFDRVEAFEPRHTGAFLAYLRQIVLNAVRDEIRRSLRRPGRAELDMELASDQPSLVEQCIGRELLELYEASLAVLPDEQQEALIMRIELGATYAEIAVALAKPTANAARMTVSRALVRLAEAMNDRRA